MAGALKEACDKLRRGLIYKTSFAKANRTSAARRAAWAAAAPPIFADIRKAFGAPVLTDAHERDQCAAVAQAVDVLQIPASCRARRICWWRRPIPANASM
jgi:2-dehydro-3-deoxyphosphooctonate aldolase (KDO 8-P synthase)